MTYDHYIALDWAQKNMAIARMTAHSDKISAVDVPASIKELQLYLIGLKGKKVLTFEETNTAQWLYTELREYVDEIIVCDPYRNRLLSEGPKTDKIDAKKLVLLLRGNLLKAVFHSGDDFILLRKLVSGYQDVIKSGVRLKNQRDAMFRSTGKKVHNTSNLDQPVEQFVLSGLNRNIDSYELEKARYQKEFGTLCKKNGTLRNLKSVPGIGEIGAVTLAAIVVDPKRFKSKGDFLSYCGLVNLEKMSGGKSYGQKRPRYCRQIKNVFKIAALSNINSGPNQPLRLYHNFLIEKKQYSDFNARHALARRIAVLTLGMWKSGKSFHQQGAPVCSEPAAIIL